MGIVPSGLSNQFGGMTSGFVGFAGNILLIIVVCGIAYGIFWYFNNRKNYNTDVSLISDRSGSTRFFGDLACYSKNKITGVWDFKLKREKETLMPPPDKCLMVGEGGKNTILMYKNSAGEIYPCVLNIDKPAEYREIEVDVTLPDGSVVKQKQKVMDVKMKVINQDILLWAVQKSKQNRDTYGHKTFWDKYGNQVMFFGTACLTLALIFMVLKKIDVVGEAARLFSEATQTLKASSVQLPSNAP